MHWRVCRCMSSFLMSRCRVRAFCSSLLWASRAFRLPLPKEGRQLLRRVGGGRASGTGRPPPMNQLVVADILRDRLDAASTIALGILDLRADLRARLAKPLHFRWRQQPDFGAGRPM